MLTPALVYGQGFKIAIKNSNKRNYASIIKRFVTPIENKKILKSSKIFSDLSHAQSVEPLIHNKVPVLIHYELMHDSGAGNNYILQNGRIFKNYKKPFDPAHAPILNIRPIDGGVEIPFLFKIELIERDLKKYSGQIVIGIRLPAIFNPIVEVSSVYCGSKRKNFKIIMGFLPNQYYIVIPLKTSDFSLRKRNGSKRKKPLLVSGKFVLGQYIQYKDSQFSDGVKKEKLVKNGKGLRQVYWDKLILESGANSMGNILTGISRLIPERDYRSLKEKENIIETANYIAENAKTPLQATRLINKVVSRILRYYENTMGRTPAQILQERFGDCDDYTRLMVALLRSLGIPSHVSFGRLYDFNQMGWHAWVEVALPIRGNKVHWFICDPTLAHAASVDRSDLFVQFKNRIYLYPVVLRVEAKGVPVDLKADLFLNWKYDISDKANFSPQAVSSVTNNFSKSFEKYVRKKILQILNNNLLFKREFLYALGSDYLLFEHEVNEGESYLRTKLTERGGLKIELGVSDDEYELSSQMDNETISRMNRVYCLLKKKIFGGGDIYYCLKLYYDRNKMSDKLQKVTLEINRYVFEKYFQKVVSALSDEKLIGTDDAKELNELYELCDGKNIYFFQENAFKYQISHVKPKYVGIREK